MDYLFLRNLIVERRPDLDLDLMDKTFAFADQAHRGQVRYSGEPYIVHPVSVAHILLDFNPDQASLQAALLHDVTEDTERALEDIEREFGAEVAALVEGMEKLAVVKVKSDDPQLDQWKNMFLAMAKDIRIVFIKLADRLHNMRTLAYVPEQKRERIARESLHVHAAIASRLGIYQIKSEMEDLCFKYLFPEDYERLAESLTSYQVRSEECMAYATSQLELLLEREGVEFEEVQGRMKHLWSIHQKLLKKEAGSPADIYDLFAVRVVLKDEIKPDGREQVAHAYGVLGLLHREYLPLQDRFKDYIAVPKPNGYRSLHSTVLGLGGDIYDEPTEVQIRTFNMHREAELGLASHWAYKLGKREKTKAAKVFQDTLDRHVAWFKGLSEEEAPRADWDLVPDRIFVLTPQRKVVDLPRGANPIDFAYAVHTEVGNKMLSAKVNGRIVPLDYELQNGEVVEIITRSNAKPSRYWISLAKTSSARSKIKNWFNKEDKESNVAAGRDMVNRELQLLGKATLDEKLTLLKNYAGKSRSISQREQLLENVGLGTVTAFQIVRTLFPPEESIRKKESKLPKPTEYTEEVLVTGEEKLPVLLSACCKPKPPHPIIGYVTRGQFIRIHRQSCPGLSGLEGERFVSAHWKEKSGRSK